MLTAAPEDGHTRKGDFLSLYAHPLELSSNIVDGENLCIHCGSYLLQACIFFLFQ